MTSSKASLSNPLKGKPLFGGESELRRYVLSSQKIMSAHLACILLCAVVYLILKLPTLASPLLFVDEGETLYNVLIVLHGKLPYRDSISHHFLGYVLPFVELAKIIGFSPLLIFLGALIHQVLGAYGLFVLSARFWSYQVALLAALLLITAREPWAIGYTPLHQLLPFITWSWFLSVVALQKRSIAALSAAFILCGVAFSFDQRAIFLAFVPLFVLANLAMEGVSLFRLFASLCSWFLFPLSAFLALFYSGAFSYWYEQTLQYPFNFRGLSGASNSYFETLYAVHEPLIRESPLLFLFAVLGCVSFVRLSTTTFMNRFSRVALVCGLVVSILPFGFFAGREFDYYTVPWLPLFAFMAPFTSTLFSMRLRPIVLSVLWVPIVIALIQGVSLFTEQDRFSSDERTVISVSRFIQKVDPDAKSKILLWGYRPDLLVFAERLSYLPFVNRQFIHPDAQVIDAKERVKHVFPLYEHRFLESLAQNPPDLVVEYRSEKDLPSKADDAVKALLENNHDLMHIFRERGGEDGSGVFLVFQKKGAVEAATQTRP